MPMRLPPHNGIEVFTLNYASWRESICEICQKFRKIQIILNLKNLKKLMKFDLKKFF